MDKKELVLEIEDDNRTTSSTDDEAAIAYELELEKCRSDLNRRRHFERQLILKHDCTTLKRHEAWFLIESLWMETWIAFVMNKSDTNHPMGAPPPGPLLNQTLVDPITQTLKKNLLLTKDYRCVHPQVYALYKEIYGVGGTCQSTPTSRKNKKKHTRKQTSEEDGFSSTPRNGMTPRHVNSPYNRFTPKHTIDTPHNDTYDENTPQNTTKTRQFFNEQSPTPTHSVSAAEDKEEQYNSSGAKPIVRWVMDIYEEPVPEKEVRQMLRGPELKARAAVTDLKYQIEGWPKRVPDPESIFYRCFCRCEFLIPFFSFICCQGPTYAKLKKRKEEESEVEYTSTRQKLKRNRLKKKDLQDDEEAEGLL